MFISLALVLPEAGYSFDIDYRINKCIMELLNIKVERNEYFISKFNNYIS